MAAIAPVSKKAKDHNQTAGDDQPAGNFEPLMIVLAPPRRPRSVGVVGC
jgi:hypothetical protein